MGKAIHILAFTALLILGVSVTDASSIGEASSQAEASAYSYADSSSEEDYCDNTKCKKPNEVYDVCPPSCPARVCGIDDRAIKCKPQPKPGDKNCNKPACRCKNGYYRDNKGNCVEWKKCPQCPANEVYDPCDAPCPERTCAFDPTVVRCAAPPKIGDPACVVGCRCIDGYLRNDKGVCVPQDQCEQRCGANEFLSECPEAVCQPKTCSEVGFPVACPMIIGGCPSQPECVCVQGYARNSEGVCIPVSECPSCGGDANAKVGCGSNCGKKCSDLDKTENGTCPVGCSAFGCDCKDGFYYSEENRRCVLPNECPTQCTRPNEVYDSCDSPCPERTCAYDPTARPCPRPARPVCIAGCRCADGYLRNSDGICIPKDKCPPHPTACRRNEVVSECANNVCGWQKCSDIDGPPLNCTNPEVCETACVCADGYYRNSDGLCVDIEECKIDNVYQGNKNSCNGVALNVGSQIFTAKLLYQAMKANPDTSVVISAFIAMLTLAELGLYTKDDTFAEIVRNLNLKTKEEIRCEFPKVLSRINVSNETDLNLAAKIYVKKGYKVTKSFKNDSKQIFGADAESIDFNKAKSAAETINKWVSGATKGKITSLVSSDMFSSLTRLVLANAIYFKGIWNTEFNPKNTKKQSFYVNNKKTIKVDMMQRRSQFFYMFNDDLDAQIVEIPYKDPNVKFIVILPKNKDGLSNLVEKLQIGQNLDIAVSRFGAETVNLYLPKFKISTKTNLKDLLTKIGVKTIFTSKAKISGMVIPDEPLYVSDALQKATITVDEKGSEAAAANAFIVNKRRAPSVPNPEIVVKCDHPFVYAIKVAKTIVFCGIYSG